MTKTTASPAERIRQLVKKTEPPTVAERVQEQYRALAERDGWPSVQIGPNGVVVGDGLPDGVPPVPTFVKAPAAVDAARALAGELAEACARLETDEAAAVEAGDADGIIAARRAKEEATIRAWSAQRDAAVAELDHYESERLRIAERVVDYSGPLDDARARIRDLQQDEGALAAAVGLVRHQMDRCESVTRRIELELDGLRRGPSEFALVAARKGRWA